MYRVIVKRSVQWCVAAAAALLAAGVTLTGSATSAAADDVLPWLSSTIDGPTAAPARRRGRASRSMRLGGPQLSDEDDRPTRPRARSKGVRVASLGNSYVPPRTRQPSLSGGNIRWVASSGCLTSSLRSILSGVASVAGSVTVNSTCRSPAHNRRVGGASKSYHLTGDAVDFRVHGSASAALAYLRSSGAGGIKHYGGGLFHIDTGPRRSW